MVVNNFTVATGFPETKKTLDLSKLQRLFLDKANCVTVNFFTRAYCAQ